MCVEPLLLSEENREEARREHEEVAAYIDEQCDIPTGIQRRLLDQAASSFDTTTSLLSALATWQRHECKDEVGANLIRKFIREFAAHERNLT